MVLKAYQSHCTNCGWTLDSASMVDNGQVDETRQPKPGDITVCLRCGHLMAFGDGMKLRDLTKEEMVAVAGDPDILSIQRARSQIKWD